MTTKRTFTWNDERPQDGQKILAYSRPMRKWLPGTYYADGCDGIIEWDDGDSCEIEEYGKDTITRWKPHAGSGE